MKSLITGPTTHDCAALSTRVEFRVLPDSRLDAWGWIPSVRVGDYLILWHPTGETRYQVDEIHYKLPPSDMWFATLSFAPRESK